MGGWVAAGCCRRGRTKRKTLKELYVHEENTRGNDVDAARREHDELHGFSWHFNFIVVFLCS